MINFKKQDQAADHYIDGSWHLGRGSEFSSMNPANGALIWRGHNATQQEAIAAVESARKAFGKWSSKSFTERAGFIKRFAEIVEKKQDALIHLISEETGKPAWESATEVSSVIGKVNLSIQAYHDRTGEKEIPMPDAKGHLRFKPHGVVVVLGPFNFPAHISNGHIVPALLAGNTVIYKPSELTPAVADFIVRCWEESGLPPGVMNCIQGDSTPAKVLLNQSIQGVYFTGSYNTGLAIHKQFSSRPEVILALEMGGNNPLLVDKVKNQTAAVYQSILSSFITAGQRCTCARRLLISDDEAGDEFLKRFNEASRNIIAGPYTQSPEPFMGPVISFHHAQAHLNAQEKLIKNGGNPLLKMELLAEQTGLLSPGIIDMTHAEATDEELFAPLVQIHRYSNFEEALSIANNTRYGLSASILTDSSERYQVFYETIRSGLVNWNRPTTGAASNLPFGGIGQSGNHRPSAYFAADYCAYPVASIEQPELMVPSSFLPGIVLS